jgi:hypothetical protein
MEHGAWSMGLRTQSKVKGFFFASFAVLTTEGGLCVLCGMTARPQDKFYLFPEILDTLLLWFFFFFLATPGNGGTIV